MKSVQKVVAQRVEEKRSEESRVRERESFDDQPAGCVSRVCAGMQRGAEATRSRGGSDRDSGDQRRLHVRSSRARPLLSTAASVPNCDQIAARECKVRTCSFRVIKGETEIRSGAAFYELDHAMFFLSLSLSLSPSSPPSSRNK